MGLSSPEALRSLGIDSAKDIINIISQFTINTFTLTSPHLNAIGITICPLAALINHSCAPNAVIVFPNSSQGRYPTLQVICIRPINPGDEIVAAYVDITLPKGIRQKFLKETYAFDCKCTECIKELALDPRDCLFCLECREGLISTRKAQACSKCGKLGSLPDDVEAKLRLGNEGLEKAEKVQWENPAYALSLTMNLMGLVSPLSPPTSHPRLALMRLLQTLSIESMSTKESDTSTSVDDVIRLSAQVVAALMDLLSRGHPIRGLAIATLGRLLCVDEPELPSDASIEQPFPPRGYQRLVLAKSTLLRAVEELEIGFGPGGGTLGTETRQMLENTDRELAIFERGVRNAKESLKQTGP
ncbi:hypothetical protein FRC14_002175 [Serendipita sp. 396]|nr:hypothetical protein FRC14_002175 [Serendipita sp. 396]